MKTPNSPPVILGIILALAAATAPATAAPVKRAAAAARLLLPYYEVDIGDPAGASTFFSVRNESLRAVDVDLAFFAADRPNTPLHSETVTLGGKRILSVDVRSKPNLVAGVDGLARGYVTIATVSGAAVIQGDYFQLTPAEDFATGRRLVNVDPTSQDNDLCSVFTLRFLNGGGFDGGTDLFFWLDPESVPENETPVVSYTVYNEAGDLRFFTEFPAGETAFRVPAADLVSILPTRFGAIELQFGDPVRGHVSAVLSALGRYSVGLEAVCGD